MNRVPTSRDFFGISIFWLAISFFWGAMLFVVVQARVSDIVKSERPALERATARGERTTAPLPTPEEKRAAESAGKELETTVAGRLSWLLGAGALVATVTQLLFGAISDNHRGRSGRRRPFIVAGTLLSVAAIGLFPFVQSYLALFAVFLFIQFAINVATGPYQALVPDLIPLELHGKASAFMGLWQLVGRTGGMVAGALLLTGSHGIAILTSTFAVLLLAMMGLTVAMTRETPLERADARGMAESIRGAFDVNLRAYPSFFWVLVSRFVINTGIYTIMPFLQYYLINSFGLTENEAFTRQALIGLIVNVTGMAATFPAGLAADRHSKKSVVYVTCAISIAGGAAFALSGSVLYALVAAGVFGFGYGAFQAVDWALVCNVLPPGEPAKYMGVWGIADCVPQIVAPIAGGAIATWTIAHFSRELGYRAVMVSAIFWFALGTLAIRWVKERRASDALDSSAPCAPEVVAADAGRGL